MLTVHVKIRKYYVLGDMYRGMQCCFRSHPAEMKTSNSSSKTRGAAAPRTRITWRSFLGLEEPSLRLLRSAKL